MLRRLNPELLALAICLFVYGWLATQGSGQFFAADPAGRGVAYDSMAASFRHFDVSVDPRAITEEGFLVNGKTHMYFGPFPSFLRFPLQFLFPSLYGQWSRLSCFLAAALCLLALRRIFAAALKDKSPRFQAVLLVLFAFGSPLYFGAASTAIYHEAILWGLAGSLAALAAFYAIALGKGRPKDYWLISMGAAVALLSRVTVGAPWLMLLGALAFRDARRRQLPCYLIPALIALGTVFFFNWARFGSPFLVQDIQAYHGTSLAAPRSLLEYGNFYLPRMPTSAMAYLWPSRFNFSGCFPYLRLAVPRVPNRSIFNGVEPVLSLLLCSPWLLLGALIGASRLARTPFKKPWQNLGALALGSSIFVILPYCTISARYLTEFLPLLILLSVEAFGTWRSPSRKTSWLLGPALGLCLAVNMLSTYAWTGEYWFATPSARRQEIFDHLRAANVLFPSGVCAPADQRALGY